MICLKKIRKNIRIVYLKRPKPLQKMIAEYIKGIPAEMKFNALSFDMSSSDGENEKYYISNIKIAKD
jgi:hypothetical protein